MISKEEFKAKREKVLEKLKETSSEQNKNLKLVLKSGREKTFSNDVKYPFRVDSDFYYLTGFREPDAVAVLDPFSENPFQLYVQPRNPEHEIWDGPREGVNGAKKNYGADAAYEADDFDNNKDGAGKKSSENTDLAEFVHSMRSVKSAAEIELMQKAADIAVQAHQVAKEIITPGIYEYEVEATLNQVFRSQGASGWSYPAIVASGANSCILHYTKNDRKIESGDLVLIDSGCEYQYYASDITRVHAASGEMTQEQKDIYDLVLAANQKAIESVKAGTSFEETHNTACEVIGEGLKELKYIKDKNDSEQIKKYYMHGTGHSLGIDVHDLGVDKKATKYVPGMVTTIEPAIYIAEKNIGVRIEDDVVVTDAEPRVLTSNLLK